MIAGLDGSLEQLNSDSVVIRVAGVSFLVYTPASTLAELGSVGDRVRLHTHLHWKEESTALYGFATSQELDLFKMLITVSGVGPKSALSVLSSLKPDDVVSAILSSDADLIAQSPGIGKKTASRMILDLKGKLEKEWGGMVAGRSTGDNADIVAALTNLGYSVADANRAAGALSHSEDLTLEEKIRLALRHLARQ